MALPSKASVLRALRASLRARLDALARVARDTRDAATHSENRQEGAKDMRATEQSYIARGQAMRVEALAEELGRLELFHPPAFGPEDPVQAGALLELDADGDLRCYLLLAQGAGSTLQVDGREILVVSPSSPVGRALLGARLGDDVTVRLRGAARDLVIEDLC